MLHRPLWPPLGRKSPLRPLLRRAACGTEICPTWSVPGTMEGGSDGQKGFLGLGFRLFPGPLGRVFSPRSSASAGEPPGLRRGLRGPGFPELVRISAGHPLRGLPGGRGGRGVREDRGEFRPELLGHHRPGERALLVPGAGLQSIRVQRLFLGRFRVPRHSGSAPSPAKRPSLRRDFLRPDPGHLAGRGGRQLLRGLPLGHPRRRLLQNRRDHRHLLRRHPDPGRPDLLVPGQGLQRIRL